jgi:N-acyl-D-amino-acid deacylase
MRVLLQLLLAMSTVSSSALAQDFDVVIKNGVIYDGTGGEGQHVDVAFRGDRIAGLGDFKDAKAKAVI